MIIEQVGDKLFATTKAWIVESPEQVPREMASEMDRSKLNPSFVWIAGRYVQANQVNRNGQYWSFEDLKVGESSIVHTPLNALHRWERPIGTYVQTKIVEREGASGQSFPEVQALAVLWGANFPEEAEMARAAHKAGALSFSMECVAESKQCLTCENSYEWLTEAAGLCEHLSSSAVAPRRFVNPTFLGGALIYPPEKPGWNDADVTEVAHRMMTEQASRPVETSAWEEKMNLLLQFSD